jgi:hypothetical protein
VVSLTPLPGPQMLDSKFKSVEGMRTLVNATTMHFKVNIQKKEIEEK